MAKLLQLPSYSDQNGTLSVFEHVFNGSLSEVEFLINKTLVNMKVSEDIAVVEESGLIVVNGTSEIKIYQSNVKYNLDNPQQCLLLGEKETFRIENYSKDCILILLKKLIVTSPK